MQFIIDLLKGSVSQEKYAELEKQQLLKEHIAAVGLLVWLRKYIGVENFDNLMEVCGDVEEKSLDA